MRQAIRGDAAIAAKTARVTWVLTQVSPRFEVLAASENRGRLVSEMSELYGADVDTGFDKTVRFVIRPTNLLFA